MKDFYKDLLKNTVEAAAYIYCTVTVVHEIVKRLKKKKED